MPEFRIINRDQMHDYEHYVTALNKEKAMKGFSASHYGTIVECEEIKPKTKCPHCGEEV